MYKRVGIHMHTKKSDATARPKRKQLFKKSWNKIFNGIGIVYWMFIVVTHTLFQYV